MERFSAKGKLTKDFEKNLAKLKRKYMKSRKRFGIPNGFSGEKINLIDGVRIDFEDSWIHIRKSNTGPIFRIIAEAKSEKKAKELVSESLKILGAN